MPFIELVAQRRAPTPPAGMQPPENAKDWFRMEATPNDDDSTDVYVYESIGGWFGMWADDFIRDLKQVSTSKINLRLNSPGGSVFDGIAIANALRAHPANVTVYVDSLAASIASVIALAGDRVVMMPQSQFMVHNASGGCYGDASEMTKMADLLDKQSLNIAKAYAEHTGGSLSDWQAYMDAETWFTAEEAVAVGLADEAVPMKQQPAEEPQPASASANMTRSWDLSMYRYAGRDNAPIPAIKQTFAAGGILTAQALADGIQPKDGEALIPLTLTTEGLGELVINLIRKELDARATTPAEPAAEAEPAVADESAPPEETPVEDASKTSPPPDTDAPEPEEEPDGDDDDPDNSHAVGPESVPAGEAAAPQEHASDTGLGTAEETVDTETYDEDSAWRGLVAGLTAAPSPSADDVFNALKEEW